MIVLVALSGRVSSSEPEAAVMFGGGFGGNGASIIERYELF